MKSKLYNQEGKIIGETTLPDEIFNTKIDFDLLHQVVMIQKANRRQPIAHAKGRSEVQGGGRKPWRQKGTGRARHGSTRSPIWKGGGVTFGPTKEKLFDRKINKKAKRKALFMAFSSKVADKEIKLLNALKLAEPKTKLIISISDALLADKKPVKKKRRPSVLLVTPEKDDNILRAAKNVPEITVSRANDLNALDLLSHKYLIIPKEAVGVIEKTYKKKN